MIKRCVLMVLDGFGVGEAPDAKEYKDEGSNTLMGIAREVPLFLPNLKSLGLYNIDEMNFDGILDQNTEAVFPSKIENLIGCFGKAQEQCDGKNSPVGHWEMAGYIKHPAFATYPNAFPQDMIEEFKNKAHIDGILCNEVGSGTEILKRFGEEHVKTGYPIVYTSADSVFQIAAHEDVIPVDRLYEICRVARKLLDNPRYNIGTVIARPFVGTTADNFTRTYNRHDFESETFGKTMLDVMQEAKDTKQVIAIGKIGDLFVGRGIDKSIRTQGNADGIAKTIQEIQQESEGLIYTNLVDFDMLYGHRNDVAGYAKALEYFDQQLPEIIEALRPEDMLIITADHGNDPSTPSTDHNREYVPILVYGKQLKQGINLGIRKTYADISATILDCLNLPSLGIGESFRKQII